MNGLIEFQFGLPGPHCEERSMTRVDRRRGSADETPFLIEIH